MGHNLLFKSALIFLMIVMKLCGHNIAIMNIIIVDLVDKHNK